MTVTRLSGCKINLLLNILRKRDDGFHELETVMQPVAFHDEIEFETGGDGVRLSSDNPALPCDDSNLIVRAANRFFAATGIPPRATIRLRKRVPMEAGLGGGSANAATTLAALNELHGRPLAVGQLLELASALGSDVPFFLGSGPALATGRGERIESLPPFAALHGLTLLLLHPGFGISTAWAYQSLAKFPEALHGRAGRARELVQALSSDGSRGWTGLLCNSLEAPAFHKYPILDMYREFFLEQGALAARMSGSGSTLFAFFTDEAAAGECVARFRPLYGNAFWHALVKV